MRSPPLAGSTSCSSAHIREEAEHAPELVKTAPHSLVVSRLDDVKAARELDLVQKA